MENMLAIKTFDIDYSFIIKNYLDKELWHKTWTLFQYKDMTVTLSLWRIDVYDNSITFRINVNNLNERETSTTMYFYVDKCDVKFLKNKINSAIFDCMYSIERVLIRENIPDVFENLRNAEVRNINDSAKEYLIDVGISSETVIDSVIDNCIDEFSKSKEYEDNYIDGMKGKLITEYLEKISEATEKKIQYSEIDSNNFLMKARKRLSVINETSIIKTEVKNYLNDDDYDVDLRMEE